MVFGKRIMLGRVPAASTTRFSSNVNGVNNRPTRTTSKLVKKMATVLSSQRPTRKRTKRPKEPRRRNELARPKRPQPLHPTQMITSPAWRALQGLKITKTMMTSKDLM